MGISSFFLGVRPVKGAGLAGSREGSRRHIIIKELTSHICIFCHMSSLLSSREA